MYEGSARDLSVAIETRVILGRRRLIASERSGTCTCVAHTPCLLRGVP